MSSFSIYSPLANNSPLFVNRTSELRFLLESCTRKVEYFSMVFGGRRMGKTSLLIRLRERLPKTTVSCWLNFQSIPGASTSQMLEYLKNQISKAISGAQLPDASAQPSLVNFDDWLNACMLQTPGQLALCLDELSALPPDTRVDLANLLRSFHHKRLEPEYESFHRLTAVLFGGIDLYDLVFTKASPLIGICETCYLDDFSFDDARRLLDEGWKDFELSDDLLDALSAGLYHLVEGHPYLTQRAGAYIAEEMKDGRSPSLDLVSEAADWMLAEDAYFTNLRDSLDERDLFDPLKDLLIRAPVYRRNSQYGLQLEVLGAIKPREHKPVLRSPLLGFALSDYLSSKLPLGALMDYELGLRLLRGTLQASAPDKLSELATLEERYRRNERDERLFGNSENTRNTRSQVIYALNEMALAYCASSFNDLCHKGSTYQSPHSTPFEQVVDSLRRIESKIDLGQVQDREVAVQILDAISQNQLDLSDANQIMHNLQSWAQNVQESGMLLSSELSTQLSAFASHPTSVEEYFQFAIPIIPGILSYNFELKNQNQLDLKSIWTKIKAKVKSRVKGDIENLSPQKMYGKGNRWAVIVGVNQYEDKIHYGDLHVCTEDALALYDQLLMDGYQKERLRMLTDHTPELPIRDNVLVALKAIAKASEPDDTLIFFYSGHGDEDCGESYLVARTGKHLALEDTAIKVSRIKRIMEEAPARAKVIILDACHSGADIDGKGLRHMTDEFIRQVFEQAEGLAILASCKQGQVSYEWRTNERSVFTYYLLEALQGQADLDAKGFITVQDVNRHVSNGVKLWASQRNLSQTPTLQAEVAGDIILANVVFG
jgi:hypothetical protein